MHLRCSAWQVLREAMDELTQVSKVALSWTGQHTHARSGAPVPAWTLLFEERQKNNLAERKMRAWQVRTPSRRRGQARQLLPFPKSSRGPSRSGRRGQESCARAGHCARVHLRLAKRSASKDSCFPKETRRKPIVWCFRSRSNIVTGSQQGCECDCPST